jgi:hypothetical protein
VTELDFVDEIDLVVGLEGGLLQRADQQAPDVRALVRAHGLALRGWGRSLLQPRQLEEAVMWRLGPDQFARIGRSGRPLALVLPDPLPLRSEVVRLLSSLGEPLPHRHGGEAVAWSETADGWRCPGCGVEVERSPI